VLAEPLIVVAEPPVVLAAPAVVEAAVVAVAADVVVAASSLLSLPQAAASSVIVTRPPMASRVVRLFTFEVSSSSCQGVDDGDGTDAR